MALRFLLLVAILAGPFTVQAEEVIMPTSDPLHIEASKGVLLRLDRPATTVFIADPEVADVQVKSPRLVYVYGRQPGQTTLYAVDSADRVLASRPISVTHDLSRLSSALRNLLPGAEISSQTVGSSLIVNGTVATASDAETVRRIASQLVDDEDKMVLNLGVAAPSQVHLRVRVAEVSRQVLKQFGINWDAAFSSTNFLFGLATATDPVTATAAIPHRASAGFRNGRWDINGLIDALDDEGLIKVLAEPNLTALSGKTATFLAGGEFPILVPDSNGRITVEFKQFGVSLAFTPTILGRDRISLKVKPEVSQLSNTGAVELAGFTVPALTTRRAETTVELGGGQSFAVAGLLQNNTSHDVRKFPGLGDVPVLGTLFRSSSFQREETELVIIVTPYIVRPVSAPALAAPTDGLLPPSDMDRIAYGRLYKPSATRPARPPRGEDGGTLRGPAGFILN